MVGRRGPYGGDLESGLGWRCGLGLRGDVAGGESCDDEEGGRERDQRLSGD